MPDETLHLDRNWMRQEKAQKLKIKKSLTWSIFKVFNAPVAEQHPLREK